MSESNNVLEEVIVHPDERVELRDTTSIESSKFYNHDLAPIPVIKRHWNALHFSALWAGMACNIPTYMMSSGLIASGMSWWQALLTILIGNTIVLAPILLNSHPGTKYGIPFPIFARASYGIIGSNLPALMRALVACGWFGINAWIGGQAFYMLIGSMFPQWLQAGVIYEGHSPTEWVSFLAFWALNLFVIYHGMDLLRRFESWAAPFVFTMTIALAAWFVSQAHGFGHLIEAPGKYQDFASFFPVFVPSVTAMIGSWSTLSLNMPDFTRFSRSQRDQVVGQLVSLPTSMTLFSGLGVVITSAGMLLFPAMNAKDLWDPIKLIGNLHDYHPALVAVAMFTVMLATLSVNIAANVVSPANDLANCFPKWISFRKGALITGLIGLAMQPWKLIADPSAYIFTWLLGYSGGLGSIGGVLIVDYWLVRKKQLNLHDLYVLDGEYKYKAGWNWNAVLATALGCFFAWIGVVYPPLHILYDYSWFVGIIVAGASYYVLMKLFGKVPSGNNAA